MKTSLHEVDLAVLPEEAKRELVDFYQFLLKRYKVKHVKKSNRFSSLISNPIQAERIVLPPREDLYER